MAATANLEGGAADSANNAQLFTQVQYHIIQSKNLSTDRAAKVRTFITYKNIDADTRDSLQRFLTRMAQSIILHHLPTGWSRRMGSRM